MEILTFRRSPRCLKKAMALRFERLCLFGYFKGLFVYRFSLILALCCMLACGDSSSSMTQSPMSGGSKNDAPSPASSTETPPGNNPPDTAQGGMYADDDPVGDMMSPQSVGTPSDRAIAQIAIGHRFSQEVGVPGRGITLLSVTRDGKIGEHLGRLELSHPITTLSYIDGGKTLVVAGERGDVSVFTDPLGGAMPTSSGKLDAFGVIAITGGGDGQVGVINRDSNPSGGVYWLSEFDDFFGFSVSRVAACPSDSPMPSEQRLGGRRWANDL